MKRILLLSCITALPFLSGCVNMPTNPDDIEPSYASYAKYEHLNCAELSYELEFFIRQEDYLVHTQNQRITDSQNHYFSRGGGIGDDIEIVDLANVRGEKKVILDTLKKKQCRF